jgi:hypothetical protein
MEGARQRRGGAEAQRVRHDEKNFPPEPAQTNKKQTRDDCRFLETIKNPLQQTVIL